ncbi:tetratricopeptide repeat protein [Candidatus Neptunochlamydia vexilliferae]|uniref:NB-ARC domain-containing protein n=1 Tax=Candidatus Neptunichlamydia vexilliferae TaxID=1651774 RepID=A0ABS0AZP5_9BACT|nr:tetratricopeptide repeat protein [Candidatus Neptunochlamydia vexilliferae]MBF5059077.1 hypothetical protein [Candidatus Neptunochlamydia vexilliferae]
MSSSSSCSPFNPQIYQIEKPKPPPKTITTTLERDKIHKLSKQKRWVVCQVWPGNSDERGSGCLIGGRLLLTNYHVLPNKKAVEKGQAVFFMVTKQEHPFGISTAKILKIELDPNFPLIQSKNNMPTPTSLPQPVKEGCLDFTIAALKPHPYLSGVQDKVFSIFKKISIKKNDPIHVLQYPHEMDSKTLISGDLKEDTGYITKKNTHDLEHSADTKKGSSGSSIIDKNGNLIALHYQGTCKVHANATKSSLEKSTDRNSLQPQTKNTTLQASRLHYGAQRGVLITQIAASLTAEEKNRIEQEIQNFSIYKSLDGPPKPHTSLTNVQEIHPDFVNREEALKFLEKSLMNSSDPLPKALLHGAGGFGKSEIAIAFANKQKKHFSIIWWIPASSEQETREAYRKLASHLKIPIDIESSTQYIIERVHDALASPSLKKNYLLIFDNATKHPKLPCRGKGSIIITTRNKNLSKLIKNQHHVDSFTRSEGNTLLEKIIGSENPQLKKKLVKALDRIPLSLTQAAYFLKDSQIFTLATYLDYLNKDPGKALKRMEGDERYPNSLYSVWSITQDQLKKSAPEAYEWLQICAYLHPDTIPISYLNTYLKIFKNQKDPFDRALKADEILKKLTGLGILRHNIKTKSHAIHRVRQEILLINMDSYSSPSSSKISMNNGCLNPIAKKSMELLSELTYEVEESVIADWYRLIPWYPHAKSFLKKNLSRLLTKRLINNDLASIHYSLGRVDYIRREYTEAKNHWKKTLEIKKKVAEAKSSYLHNCFFISYGLYSSQVAERRLTHKQNDKKCSSSKSANFLSKKIEYSEKNSCPQPKQLNNFHKYSKDVVEHFVDLANCITNLGHTYCELKKYDKALKSFQKSFNILDFFFNQAPNQELSVAKNNLGYLVLKKGCQKKESLQRAIEQFQEAHNILETIQSSNKPLIATFLRNIGEAFDRSNNLDEAESFYTKAIDCFQEPHSLKARCLHEYGNVLRKKYPKQWTLAKKKYLEAIEIFEICLSTRNCLVIANCLVDLGTLLNESGNIKDARSSLTEALAIKKNILGKNHIDVSAVNKLIAALSSSNY